MPYVQSKLTATELTVYMLPVDVAGRMARKRQLVPNNPKLLCEIGAETLTEEEFKNGRRQALREIKNSTP